MDIQEYVDGFLKPTCMVSVDPEGSGSYGEIRIVAGNEAYIGKVNANAGPDTGIKQFSADAPYTNYIARDLNFEEICCRAGGDEFMMILPGCTEEDFNAKVAALKERSADPEFVCFAVGSCFCATERDIRGVMREADENMYADKGEYYDRYPERMHR